MTFLNAEAERLTGWPGGEALGRPLIEVFKIINGHTGEAVENPADKVLRLGTTVGLANHTVLIAKDGRQIAIDDSGAPVRSPDGAVHGVVLVFRDFTEKKLGQAGLARLAAIVDSSEDVIRSKNLDGTILTWNAAAEGLFGYRAEEIVGKPITVLVPLDRTEEEDRILASLRRGEHVEHFDTVRLSKDGRRIDVSVNVSPLRDSDGRTSGASTLLRDITGRKRRDALLQTRLRLSELAQHVGIDELVVQTALDEAERLTGSCIGYFHLVDDDQQIGVGSP